MVSKRNHFGFYYGAKCMKKIIISLLAGLILFTGSGNVASAKVRIDAVKNGTFIELSDEDMKDTVQALTDKIVKDCGVTREKKTSCYDWEESPVIAYNLLICDIICVNMTGFRTTTDADAAGETVEYHLVKTLAHEVRHSYQYEHRLDGTEYGNACFQGFADYEAYNGDRETYYSQFIEADAEQYGAEYANKYFNK